VALPSDETLPPTVAELEVTIVTVDVVTDGVITFCNVVKIT
jgi:hypothetical protein